MPAPLPVLYNLGGSPGSAWDLPQVRSAVFYIFVDGSAALTGMRWAHWNDTSAVTSSATYYDRSGPCCTKSDQHYYKVTVTLSDISPGGGPRPGSYFGRMVIAGHGFRTIAYTYKVSFIGNVVMGARTGGPS